MAINSIDASVRLEMQHLLSGLCDGELTDQEQDRLEALLTESSDCRIIYLQYMDLHSHLLIAGREHVLTPCGVDHEFLCAVSNKTTTVAEHPSPADVADSTKTLRQSSAAIAYRYAVVVAFAVVVTVMVQVVLSRTSEIGQAKDVPRQDIPSAAKSALKDDFVATLRDAVDCVWEKPAQVMPVGARLAQGDVQLPKGIAYVQFDSGPEIVVEGPAALRLESSTAVTVLSGKVVLRADESSAPFDIYTPNSTLAEAGTEFAIDVNADTEEIHVFAGEVQRTAKIDRGGKPEQLKAGEARHYGKLAAFGKPMAYDPKKFVRHFASRHTSQDGLLAYEGFDYRFANVLLAGKANGGKGWFGPWKAGFTRPNADNETPRFALNPRESLSRRAPAAASVGGSFEYAGFASASRRLARPVRMDSDADYFFSFLVRRHGPQSDPFNSAGILLWTHDDIMQQKFENARQRLFIGLKKSNLLAARLQQMDTQAPVSMTDGATQLIVAKVVSNRTGADQVFIHLYGPDNIVDSSEPTSWQVRSSPFQSDLTFDWLQLHINSKTRHTIDELRVGTTWSSVTAPHQKQ